MDEEVALKRASNPDEDQPALPGLGQPGKQDTDLSRILSISDCVIAVAMTLLVLDIVTPTPTSSRPLATQLLQDTLPGVLAFLYSYVIVANLWFFHQRIFREIKRYDSRLVLLNLLFLALIVFLPIPVYLFTRVGNITPTWDFYALTSSATGFVLFLMWLYASWRHRLIDADMNPLLIQYLGLRLLVLPLSFLISLAIAQEFGVVAAELSLIVISALYRLARRIYRRRVDTSDGVWENARLLTLSDGAIAVAMTLLVAKIALPTGPVSPQHALQILQQLRPQISAYILSFVIVALYWSSHHRLFHIIKLQDDRLTFLNFLFLLCIQLLPIVNSVFAFFGDQKLAIILYALAQATMGLMLLAIWLYATHKHRLIASTVSQQRINTTAINIGVAPLIFLLSVGVAYLRPNLVSFVWLLIVVVQIIFQRFWHRR